MERSELRLKATPAQERLPPINNRHSSIYQFPVWFRLVRVGGRVLDTVFSSITPTLSIVFKNSVHFDVDTLDHEILNTK